MADKFKLPRRNQMLRAAKLGVINFRDKNLYEKIRAVSERTGVPMTTITRAAVEYALDNLDESSFAETSE